MDNFPKIHVATAYQLAGQVLDSFPADLQNLARAEVQYTTLPGWQTPKTGAEGYYDLPKNARAYVEFIEETHRRESQVHRYRTGEIGYDCQIMSVSYR